MAPTLRPGAADAGRARWRGAARVGHRAAQAAGGQRGISVGRERPENVANTRAAARILTQSVLLNWESKR